MKRIGSVLIALLLVFSCTACGNGQQTGENAMEPSSKQTEGNVSGSDETASSGQTENHDNTVADTENTTGKTLVVYYSATGTTKKVAGYISAATDGDLFEIVPAKIYTDEDLDWTDQDSRVCREHDNESERNVELAAVAVDNWNEYDTVFIGFAGGIIGLNQEKPQNQGFALIQSYLFKPIQVEIEDSAGQNRKPTSKKSGMPVTDAAILWLLGR